VRNKLLPPRQGRSYWIVLEVQKLCDIVNNHLQTAEVGGRWSKINWEVVRDTYNNYWAGKIQRSTELRAESLHTKIVPKTLGIEREAPKRTATTLRLAMPKFTDDKATNLVAAARAVDNLFKGPKGPPDAQKDD
jgi:hypothetical protein